MGKSENLPLASVLSRRLFLKYLGASSAFLAFPVAASQEVLSHYPSFQGEEQIQMYIILMDQLTIMLPTNLMAP